MVLKVGAAIVGLVILGSVGVSANKSWFGAGDMPEATLLAPRADINNKWGDYHRAYFIDSLDNDAWFNWSFQERYSSKDVNNKTIFKDLKSGKELAKSCEEAYKADYSKVKKIAVEVGESDFFEDNIWKYCSYAGQQISLA